MIYLGPQTSESPHPAVSFGNIMCRDQTGDPPVVFSVEDGKLLGGDNGGAIRVARDEDFKEPQNAQNHRVENLANIFIGSCMAGGRLLFPKWSNPYSDYSQKRIRVVLQQA